MDFKFKLLIILKILLIFLLDNQLMYFDLITVLNRLQILGNIYFVSKLIFKFF